MARKKMTNTRKIRAAMILHGYTQKSLAKELGISSTSFSYKLHNKSDFKATEIDMLSERLEIANKDEYFFNGNVNVGNING